MTHDELMGQIADTLRALVGGRDINGFNRRAAGIEDAAALIPRLRRLLDEYDLAMIEETRARLRKDSENHLQSD